MGFDRTAVAVRYFMRPETALGDRSRGVLTALLLTALCLVLWMAPAGLWDLRGADETRYTLIAREWLAGDGIVKMTVLGEPYDQKPPLPFYLFALMISAAGGEISSWSLRLPSVLLGIAGVLGTWLIGRRHFGERAGLLSALVLMTSSQWMMDTPSAELNIMFSGWIVLSLACWFLRPEPTLSWRCAAAMWLLLAAAFFTKGPLAILIVVSVIAGEAIARRSFAPLRQAKLWQGLLLNGALIALWLWAQRMEAGAEFVGEQVSGQTVDRFLSGDHEGPFWYYFHRLFVSIMFPWAILLLPMGQRWLRGHRRLSPVVRTILAGWIGFPFLVLMLASGKRETYLLPLLPGLALLIGAYLDGRLARNENRRLAISHILNGLFSFLALFAAATLVTGGIVLIARPDWLWNHDFLLRRWQLTPIVILASLFVWTALIVRSRRHETATAIVGLCSLLFLGALTMFTLARPALGHHKSTRSFTESLDAFLAKNDLGNAVGLLDRADKPEYHVYGRYLGVSLDRDDLMPGARLRLPNVLVVREDDWKNVAANRKRLADAGYAPAAEYAATRDLLTVYARNDPAAAEPASQATLRFGMAGDTGRDTKCASNVAGGILDAHHESPLSAVFLLGDNLYGYDPFEESIGDRFEKNFGALLSAGVPVHAALGNHDLKGGYERDELVYEPFGMGGDSYYDLTFGDDLVTFFVLDHYDLTTSPDQILWLERSLLTCRSKWRLVVMHEPLHSTTDIHGLSESVRSLLTPVFRGGGVQAVFAGHLHVYERPPFEDILQVTSGGGSKVDGDAVEARTADSILYNTQGTFLRLAVSEEQAVCEAVAEDGTVVDRFRIAANGSGAEPIAIASTADSRE